MPEINDIPEQQAPATGGDPRRALYDKLHQAEYYTKSYDEFNKKYSDSASREKLYSVLNQEGFYTKSKQDFDSKYFSDQQEKPSTERSMMPVKAPGWNFANQVIDQAQRLTSGDEPQTDDHAKEVQQATKTVQNAWGDIDRTAKNHILYTEDMDKGAQAQAPISDNTAVSRQLPPLLRQREEEARKNAIPTDQIEALKADPNQTGTLLNLKKVELQREGKHQEANDLQAAAYALDSQYRATGDKKEKIQNNIQDLKKGELVYNARTGDLVRHAGIFESIKIGHENRNKAYQGGLDIMGASKDDRIKMAEKELNDKDPDDPVPSPSSVWSTVGSEGMMFAKGALGALAGGSLTSSPLGAAAGYTAMTSDEVAGRAVHDEYMRTYPQVKSELSKQHPEMSDAEINNIADDKAYQLAKVAGLTGGVTNAALSLTGGSALAETVNAADKPLVGGFTRRALSTAENVLKGIAKDSKEKLPSGLLTAGVAGGGELLKGEMANRIGVKRDAGSEALGAAEQMLVLHHVMVAGGHAIGGARRLLTSSLSKQPPGVIAQAAHDAVLDGTLSSGQAKDLLNDVAQQNVRDAQIPAHVTDPQARLEIQDKMDKYDDLKKQLGKPEEGGLHEAHHPIIKDLMGRTEWEINMLAAKPEEQIKILKDKQTELKNNLESHNEAKRSGEAGKLEYPDADRAQLSDVERRIKDVQEKVDSPLYKAAKIIKEGNTKGFSKEVLEQAADDPEELKSHLKDISEQLRDPNSREVTIDTFGKKLTDVVDELYPEKPRVSVQMPGERKNPETITIKPTPDAGPVGGPEEIPVGEPPRSGAEVGQRVPESEKPSSAQKEFGQNKSEEEPPVEPPAKDDLPFSESEGSEKIGVAHRLQEGRIGEEHVIRGEGVTVQEAVSHGRELLAKGRDPQKVADAFKKDGKISYDALSLARAHYERLARETNHAIEVHGDGSPEANAAIDKESKWLSGVVKPMQTEWSKIGTTQQGATDIDTGTLSGMKRAYREETGKELTPVQTRNAKNLSEKVKDLNEQVETLKSKLTEVVDDVYKNAHTPEGLKQKAKKLAEAIRKGKLSRPDTFSAASPASLVWDTAIEIVAKTVEISGSIAEAVAKGVESIKSSDWYKGLDESAKKNAIESFTDHLDEHKPPTDLFSQFANKKDANFSPEEVKAIWSYAKSEYLDNGAGVGETLSKVGKDLGLNTKQVMRAIAAPKGARVILDEMYKKQQARIQAINEAKRWLKTNNNSLGKKFLGALPNAFFALKTFGHGTVGGITHAGMQIFQPSTWKLYFPFFVKQFKFAFGDSLKYAKAMEDLKSDPDFIPWKRAGLAVDPKETYDEYQGASRWMGKIGETGTRGFNALKVLRIDLAKYFYGKLSNIEKSDPESMKEIAKLVNHATGTSEVNFGKAGGAANTLLFAPKLEVSRWQRLVSDPAKAVHTFTRWNKSTPAERAGAKRLAKNAGQMIATYCGALAANAGLLAAAGSKQKINFSDPTQSDFMKFKAGDKTIDVSAGMLSTFRLLYSLGQQGVLAYTGSKKELRKKPGEKQSELLTTQLRYKLSPFASTVADVFSGTDAMGKPLPFSHVKPKKGETGYTLKEYLLHQQTPIPISEGIRSAVESMKENGMTKVQVDNVLEGILTGALSGGTGAKLAPDRSLHQGGSGGGGGATGLITK